MDISTFQRWWAAERGEVLIFWALVVQAQFHQHASIPPWNPTRTDQVRTKQSTGDQALLLWNPKAFEMLSDQYVSSWHGLVVCQTEGAICCEGKDLNYWLCLGPKTEP